MTYFAYREHLSAVFKHASDEVFRLGLDIWGTSAHLWSSMCGIWGQLEKAAESCGYDIFSTMQMSGMRSHLINFMAIAVYVELLVNVDASERVEKMITYRRIVVDDLNETVKKDEAYDGSWKKRGGVGAFMMLARKWDRMEAAMIHHGTADIVKAIRLDTRGENMLDDLQDLRRYLGLVEAHMRAQDFLRSNE